MADRTGQQFGNYRLLRLLGRGGFAEVYLGQHLRLASQQSAIKILSAHLDEVDIRAFEREAETVASLVHPHIVRVLDYDVTEGLPFLVMDYAPNGSLRQRHRLGTPVPLPTVISYVQQVADGLQYAHEQKCIHRDIKPDNMLIGRRGEILLSDFGIATIAHSTTSQSTQAAIGTIPYMAPEQIQEHPRPASDQYALAITVYEWLVGERPFSGSFTEIAVKHAMMPPPSLRAKRPEISSEIEQVVLIALAKDPKARFVSVQAFALALKEAGIAPTVLPQPPREEVVVEELAVPPLTLSVQTLPASNVLSPPIPTQIASGEVVVEATDTPLASPITQPDLPPPAPVMLLPTGEAAALEPDVQTGAPVLISVEEKPAERRLSRRTVLVAGSAIAGMAAIGGVFAFRIFTQKPIGSHLYTYRGHSESVGAVAWSPNGQRIASGSVDDTVQVWDATNGGNVYTYNGHSNPVVAVAWSPDGKRIASGSDDRTVQVWDATNGESVYTYNGHSNPVVAVAWSPDSQRIASGSLDGTVQVWDAADGGNVYTYRGHSDWVYAVAWSPNGQRIASGSIDNTVRVWDATNGGNAYTYSGHSGGVVAVAWSPDGKRIASGGNDRTVQVWDATDGGKIYTYHGHSNLVFAVTWSPNSQRIASGSFDSTVQVWDATSGGNAYTYHGHSKSVYAVVWSPDGQHIASGSLDSTVQVWSADS